MTHWYRIGTRYRPIRKFRYRNRYREAKNGIRPSLVLSLKSEFWEKSQNSDFNLRFLTLSSEFWLILFRTILWQWQRPNVNRHIPLWAHIPLSQLFGDFHIPPLWGSITLTWKHGEQSDVLVASFSLLAEHVPTVVNLSMYRALVGTVWATIRTGASIHHGQVTYSNLSGETKWSFWRNVNNSQWTIRGAISTLQLENRVQREFSLPLTFRASCAHADVFPYVF